MFRSLSIPFLLAFALLASPFALGQTSDTPKEPQAASEATPPAQPPKNNAPKTGSDGEAFVDRDGDGIHDGKEHRFRKQRHGKRNRDNEDGSFQHQYRNRKGKSGS
ncbi:MAG: hypothetical protein GYA21_05165 [Myxococcales bacterium]|nr:hypothetical protein [Myxococcales bacterium]